MNSNAALFCGYPSGTLDAAMQPFKRKCCAGARRHARLSVVLSVGGLLAGLALMRHFA
jgi:hypothetical protein